MLFRCLRKTGLGARFASGKSSKIKVGILAIPFCKGQPKPGVDHGPELLKSTGFMNELRAIGVDVKDYGAIDFSSLSPETDTVSNENAVLKNTNAVASGNILISDAVKKILSDGRVSLNLGGDHSMGIGTVHAASEIYEDLCVIWVDAHADLNTPSTSPSGNYHGMPVSFLIPELQPHVAKISQFSWITPRIKAKNLFYVGLRDVDTYERRIIELLGITAFSMKEISSLGIEKVMDIVLDKVGGRRFHLSFDIDSLDDLEVKSTGTPVPGGLTLREGLTIVEILRDTGKMVSMDLVELNPLIGNPMEVDRSAKAAKHLLVNAFGYYRGGVAVKKDLPTTLKHGPELKSDTPNDSKSS